MVLSPETVTINKASQVMSVIIPVLTQQSKIFYFLEKIKQAVGSAFNNYELIIVNDGSSTDNILTILRGIAWMDPHTRVLSYTSNRGKGYAVRHGVLQSHEDAVMLLDGDLDIFPDLMKDYVERLSISDLVIASKKHPKSSVTIPRSRAFLNRAFNLLIRMATGIIAQKYTQTEFKVGHGEIMRTIFRNASVNHYAFNVELFTIAFILHLKIQEMPIIMKIDRQFNTKEIVNMFADIIRICYRHRVLHAYQKELAVHFYQLNWKIMGVSIDRMVLQHSEVFLSLNWM
jgi:glycosyltransferase involved in cell wall biosynthesis